MSELMDYAFSSDALHQSYLKTKQNINFKYSVQQYGLNELKEINHFQEKYYGGTFRFSKGNEFTLCERGKQRKIVTTVYRDRVPVHSFCENVLIKELRPYLIYDNCASLKERGIDRQRERFRVHLMKYYREHRTNDGFILKGDFTKFFDNLQHEKLIAAIEEKIPDKETIDFLRQILKEFEVDVSYMTDDEYEGCIDRIFNALEYFRTIPDNQKTGEKFMRKSVGIGNEASQISGVFYPTPIDNLVKNVLGFKYYGRYMDDFYIISDDKTKLFDALDRIKVFVKDLGIFLNEQKTYIQRLNRTVTFLKVRYDLTETGRVTMRLSKEIFKRERVKLKKFRSMLDSGELTFDIIQAQYRSWRGTITRRRRVKGRKQKKPIYHNYRQLKEMDRLYNELFIEPFIVGNY